MGQRNTSQSKTRQDIALPSAVAQDGATRAAIAAAINRILGGDAESPELTIVNLAREAHVGRATVNRHPDLKAQFWMQLDKAVHGSSAATNPVIRIMQLELQLRTQQAAMAALRQSNGTMAQQILFLTERYRRLAEQVQTLREHEDGTVIAIESHVIPTRRSPRSHRRH